MSPGARTATAPRAAQMGRALMRLLRAAAVVALLGLGLAPAASAHATLERSDPPNGGMVATGRTTLTLWYGEAITESASSFTVQGDQGAVPATVALDDGDQVVHLTTAPLERGTYTLSWAVVAADGHPTKGTVIFGSGFRPDGIPNADSSLPDALPVVLRSADLGGTLVALGALLALWRVVPVLGRLARTTGRRALTAGAFGVTVALAAAIATPVVTTASQVGDGAAAGAWLSALDDVLVGSAWGRLWMVRVLCLVVAYLALWRARRDIGRRGTAPGGRTRSTVVVAAALVVSVGLDSWAGHASALPSGQVLAWAAASAHVLAAGAWAGGLLVLALVLRPLALLDRAGRAGLAIAGWRAFSPVAALSSGVLLATGLYEAGLHVDSWSALSRGVYGPAVLGKVAVVAVALTIAGYNTLVVNERLADRVGRVSGLGRGWRPRPRPLRTTVLVEAGVLSLAIVLAALMTSVPTAREVTAAATATAPQSDRADGLFVTVEAVPTGREVRLVVRAQAVVKPLGTPVTGVEVGVSDGLATEPTTRQEERLVLTQSEPGRYEGRIPAPAAQDWTAEVFLHRAGARTTVMLVPWSSAEPRSPFRTLASVTALGLLVAIGAVLVLVLLRRRRTTPEPPPDAPTDRPRPAVLEEAGRR